MLLVLPGNYSPHECRSLRSQDNRRGQGRIASWTLAKILPLPSYGIQQGPFIVPGRAMVGQWGLIPYGSKTRKPTRSDGKPLSTNNCRRRLLPPPGPSADLGRAGSAA